MRRPPTVLAQRPVSGLAEYRVGPHGYIHGWIFVGIPAAGAKVFHPQHGHGTVTETDGKHVTVGFGDGAKHSFETRPGTGAPRLEPRESHKRVTSSGGLLQVSLSSEHRKTLKTQVKDTRKRLSPGQRKTVEQWTAGKGMVRRIQTGKVSADTARNFDEAMFEAPKVDGLVYRGVVPGSHGAQIAESLRVGGTMTLDEPVSTSIDPKQAVSFGTYVFEIDSPAASYIAGIGSKYTYEQEAVLAPGRFQVTSIEDGKVGLGPNGTAAVRIIRLKDVSQGGRSWLPAGVATSGRAASSSDDGDDGDDGDRSDRFMQGDGLGQFKPGGASARTAQTPAASTVHHPFGSPSGPGLFHVKGLQLPAYIQNVAHAFRRQGAGESEAIARAIGVVKDWAAGRTPSGKGHVHPDVQAAAAKAVAEWEAAKAQAGGGKRFNPFHAPPGPGGGEFATGGGGGAGAAAKTRAKRKAHLLGQAKGDRQKAHELQQQVDLLEKQAKQHAASATSAGKSAHHKKISPHAKHRNPGHKGQHPAKKAHQAAAKAHTATASLHTRIADLKQQIHGLLAKASSLEAQAKRL